jgi:hypothetical protein
MNGFSLTKKKTIPALCLIIETFANHLAYKSGFSPWSDHLNVCSGADLKQGIRKSKRSSFPQTAMLTALGPSAFDSADCDTSSVLP